MVNATGVQNWRMRDGKIANIAPPILPPMHFDSHQNIIDDLEARILTIRDSL
jgi:hypothetical protein